MNQKLVFGDTEQIKMVKAEARRMLIQEHIEQNRDKIIKQHWGSHFKECGECGSVIEHAGDEDPAFEVLGQSPKGKLVIRLICVEGESCDHEAEIEIDLAPEPHKDLPGQTAFA